MFVIFITLVVLFSGMLEEAEEEAGKRNMNDRRNTTIGVAEN